ncbi:MAG: protein kinase domain-containing protein [Gemmatimonadota bacterium]
MAQTSSQRWARIEELCDEALARPAAERRRFLEAACAGDPGLLEEVQSLISGLEDDPGFLESPIVGAARDEPDDFAEGSVIGSCRIVRSLGRGGMGHVFLAVREAEDVRQNVAVKVIRRGMDTDAVLRRFRLERRILASLDHPNVARLLDAGATPDGRPFFVMEFVDGTPLTEYCTTMKLGLRQRVELVERICQAVQHIHQHLVVHRDLKPRNILVTSDGTPKILDFGIGKVLGGDSDALGPGVDTETDVRLLTPDYAAPEQITGGPITTATDVHALGVILFELLTGSHPWSSTPLTRTQLERAVLETEPVKPSSIVMKATGSARLPAGSPPAGLRRQLSGDLDNIALMALRKDPARRYPSAAALAEDLSRHLNGLPVRARADTLAYRSQKFVSRNLAAVMAGTSVAIALVTTSIVTVVQSRRVGRESAQVALERDKALEVRGFLMEIFGASGADRAAGDTLTARQLLDLQASQVDRTYASRPLVRADMLEALSDGYDRLGLYARAESLSAVALNIRRALLPRDHPDVAASLSALGWITHERGQSREAEPILLEAIAIRRAGGTNGRAELARSLNDLGVVYNALNRFGEADSVLNEALRIRRELFGDSHRAVGITASNIAAMYYLSSRYAEALRLQQLSLDALQQAVGPDHQRTLIALANLAAMRRASGDFGGAEVMYRELLVRQVRVIGPRHPVGALRMVALANLLTERGGIEGSDTLLAEAEGLLKEALAIAEESFDPRHPQVGTTLDRLALVLLARNRPGEALRAAERAVGILRTSRGPNHQSTGQAIGRIALIRWRTMGVRAAIPHQEEAVRIVAGSAGEQHPEAALMRSVLCEMYLHDNRATDALNVCRLAEAVLSKAPPGFARGLSQARLRLAWALASSGSDQVADSLLAMLKADTITRAPRELKLLDSLLTSRLHR